MNGSLETSDAQLADGTFYDPYGLTVQETEEITLQLASGEVDAFLYLLDERAGLIEADDDGGGGTDAQVERSLDRGCYVLYANSVSPATGAYTLSATITPPVE